MKLFIGILFGIVFLVCLSPVIAQPDEVLADGTPPLTRRVAGDNFQLRGVRKLIDTQARRPLVGVPSYVVILPSSSFPQARRDWLNRYASG